MNRIGKIPFNKNYRSSINDYLTQKYYFDISDVDFKKPQEFDVITIGDSFSKQGNNGYLNFISHIGGKKVLSLSQSVENDNPLQFLHSIINGDLFETIKTDYIILENVERSFVGIAKKIDKNFILTTGKITKSKMNTTNINPFIGFLSDSIKYPLFSLLYIFDDRAFISKVYKTPISKNLFSTKERQLIFYYKDVSNIGDNTQSHIHELNNELNFVSLKLKALGIKFIVLPASDKYDIYYKYIIDNKYPQNHFFDYLENETKKYLYVDTKTLLQELLNLGEKDVYYADDTHWSPKGAKVIAEHILSLMNPFYYTH